MLAVGESGQSDSDESNGSAESLGFGYQGVYGCADFVVQGCGEFQTLGVGFGGEVCVANLEGQGLCLESRFAECVGCSFGEIEEEEPVGEYFAKFGYVALDSAAIP